MPKYSENHCFELFLKMVSSLPFYMLLGLTEALVLSIITHPKTTITFGFLRNGCMLLPYING